MRLDRRVEARLAELRQAWEREIPERRRLLDLRAAFGLCHAEDMPAPDWLAEALQGYLWHQYDTESARQHRRRQCRARMQVNAVLDAMKAARFTHLGWEDVPEKYFRRASEKLDGTDAALNWEAIKKVFQRHHTRPRKAAWTSGQLK